MNKKTVLYFLGPPLLLVPIVAFFDLTLSIGICMLVFLSALTLISLMFFKVEDNKLYTLFFVSLVLHVLVVLFLQYSHFQPFSDGIGDYTIYNSEAQTALASFLGGNFSLSGVSLTTYFPVLIAFVYFFTVPKMLIGVLFAAFLGAITAVLVFLMVKELGGSGKQSFLTGLVTNFYASYMFYGSLLLRDIIIIPLAVFGLWLIIRMAKRFLWVDFFLLYLVLAAEFQLRIYIGYAVLLSFVVCFVFLSVFTLKRKIIYALIIIPILGFLPQISGYGYYGSNFLEQYLNPKTVALYQNLYNPASPLSLSPSVPSSSSSQVALQELQKKVRPSAPVVKPASGYPVISPQPVSKGLDSSFVVNIDKRSPVTFVVSYLKYFCYILLGPFPWQMSSPRQYFAFLETIPWYFLLFFVAKGILGSLKSKNRLIIPLLVFGLSALVALAVYVSNFGIITRIRIPAFISLLCLAPLAFIKKGEEKQKKHVRYSGNY